MADRGDAGLVHRLITVIGDLYPWLKRVRPVPVAACYLDGHQPGLGGLSISPLSCGPPDLPCGKPKRDDRRGRGADRTNPADKLNLRHRVSVDDLDRDLPRLSHDQCPSYDPEIPRAARPWQGVRVTLFWQNTT